MSTHQIVQQQEWGDCSSKSNVPMGTELGIDCTHCGHLVAMHSHKRGCAACALTRMIAGHSHPHSHSENP